MWIGDIFIHYKEGTLPNPRSGDTLCFEAVEAPNRDMALMQVMEHHARVYFDSLQAKEFHPECPNAPWLNTIIGFKFRAYPKRCTSEVCRVAKPT